MIRQAQNPQSLSRKCPPSTSSRARLHLCRARKTAPPQQNPINSRRHKLSDGQELEILFQAGLNYPERPPLLFLHGAGHGAWIWAEHLMHYFSDAGYDVYAVSMRGHGTSDAPENTDSAGTLISNAEDLAGVITSAIPAAPILVGHSFGGLIAQRYLALCETEQFCGVAGAAFLGSAPPSGSKSMVPRFLKRSPFKSLMATASLISKNYRTNLGALRLLFFSDNLPESELKRLQGKFNEFNPKTRLLDLVKLPGETPLPPLPEANRPPCAVIGFREDSLVDEEGCVELAEYLGTKAIMLDGIGHDGMLDEGWPEVAEALLDFCDRVSADAADPADRAEYARA